MKRCKDCDYASEVASDRHGIKVETLCVPCRDALRDKVMATPLPGKKGNHSEL